MYYCIVKKAKLKFVANKLKKIEFFFNFLIKISLLVFSQNPLKNFHRGRGPKHQPNILDSWKDIAGNKEAIKNQLRSSWHENWQKFLSCVFTQKILFTNCNFAIQIIFKEKNVTHLVSQSNFDTFSVNWYQIAAIFCFLSIIVALNRPTFWQRKSFN